MKNPAMSDSQFRASESRASSAYRIDDPFLNLSDAEKQRLAGLYGGLREKLLDLSRRNPMLNFKLSPRLKRYLQFVDRAPEDVHDKLAYDQASIDIEALPEPDDLPEDEKTEEFQSALAHAKVSDLEYLMKLEALDGLARDDEFEITKLDRWLSDKVRASLGMPKLKGRKELDLIAHARKHGINPDMNLPAAAKQVSGKANKLQTMLFPDDLEARLEKISDAARLSQQEMGLSTLFLAIGFLEWYEAEHSDRVNYAPLLLLPVRLDERTVRGKPVFSLTATAEWAETNVNLEKYLEKEHGRNLPAFGADEENQPSVEEYFAEVQEAIKGLEQWKVRRYMVLGHFAFGRLAMYEDLNPEKWKLTPAGDPLVKAILTGAEGSGEGSSLTIPQDYEIDNAEVEAIAPVLIHDADASQHSAIIDVMKGSNLVVEGPPGTGKSQTITNIIANALNEGKSVLFLAEKLAALEVVKRRLDRAGLGDFCLELHSDKASPRAVIDSLRRRAELGRPRFDPTARRMDLKTWESAKDLTKTYLTALHSPGEDEQTPFTLMWRAIAGRSEFDSEILRGTGPVKLPDNLLGDPNEALVARNRIDVLARILISFEASFGPISDTPWSSFASLHGARYEAEGILALIQTLGETAGRIASHLDGQDDLGVETLADLRSVIANAPSLPAPPDLGLVPDVVDLGIDKVGEAVSMRRKISHLQAAVAPHRDIAGLPDATLQLAKRVDEFTWSADVRNRMTPAVAKNEARTLADGVAALIAAAGHLRPAYDILKMAVRDVRALEPLGVALATTVDLLAGRSTEHARLWAWLPAGDVGSFRKVLERWRSLRQADQDLRTRVPAYDPAKRPEASALEAAATVLNKGMFGRMFASFGGELKQARAVATELGLDPKADTVGDTIADLARHLRALASFEGDADSKRTVGDLWKGFDTPFEELATALDNRDALRSKLEKSYDGDGIARRLLGLGPDALAQFVALADGSASLRTVLALPDLIGDGPLEQRVDAWKKHHAHLNAFVELDPNNTLGLIDMTLAELAGIAGAELERRSLAKDLRAHEACDLLDRQSGAPGGLDQLEDVLKWMNRVVESGLPGTVCESLIDVNGSAVFNELKALAGQAQEDVEQLDRTVNDLRSGFGIDNLGENGTPAEIVRLASRLLDRGHELADYLGLLESRSEVVSAGLGDVVHALEDAAPANYEIWARVFEYLVTTQRADRARRQNTVLAQASGMNLDAMRRAFADQDALKVQKDRREILASLLSSTKMHSGMNSGPRRSWTEMALLENEFRKSRRFTPVRALLDRAPKSIRDLKPCFMMSPLSLAKYLPRSGFLFDILVIDEASQMKPEDALGALLRVKQVIVVGDPKQLPPTDFFNRSMEVANDADDFEDIDSESILEACQKTFRTVRRLKWHYRSRCESLIAFSNKEFYEGGLITFPMAKPDSFSIDLVPVRGAYQQRRNVSEAQQAAEEAIAFMRHHAELPEDVVPTLGIVAVNTDQRDLIFEELRRLEAGDELVKIYREKVAAKGEPVFVKNLENVQGDERDYVFISLTYGPAPGSKQVLQRFGPIAGKQGHRRLNVLFSRARIRVVLFTSMSSMDVKPSDTSSHGVHVLKRYLAYAEARGRAPSESVGSEFESDFEMEVARRLEDRGYKVDKQVGVSGFRIDLGIRHPDQPGVYIAGIECDGATYHSSKSARDRDRLREEVLRGLGWNILRVWSTDWFYNADTQTERLVKQIEALRKAPVTAYPEYRVTIPEPTPATEFEPQPAAAAPPEDRPVDKAAAPHGPDGTLFDLEPVQAPKKTAETQAALPLGFASTKAAQVRPNGTITLEQARAELEEFRRTRIEAEFPGAEPQRSILRKQMIDVMLARRFDDPDDFFAKIPDILRRGTDARQKIYLEDICTIIGRMEA
jgi:very-short-patch-repair endonuclease